MVTQRRSGNDKYAVTQNHKRADINRTNDCTDQGRGASWETSRETRDTGKIVENNEEEMIGEGAPVTPETDPETDADADGEETSL